jgi:hypothetical protein
LKTFERIGLNYDKDERAGGIYAENRGGEKCLFYLVSLSIGLVNSETAC